MRSDAALDAAAATARLRRSSTAATSRPFGTSAVGPTATCGAAAALLAVTALLGATTLRRAARASPRGAPGRAATTAGVLATLAATTTTLSVSALTTSSFAHFFQALADPLAQLTTPCASAHLLEALT